MNAYSVVGLTKDSIEQRANALDNGFISNYNENMETRNIISLISKIRESANRFIINEMEHYGVKGLATSHGDIISALLQSETMTMKELAERIGKDKSTVTALVDKLIKQEYVQKSKDINDSRVTYVSLTEKGLELGPIFETISQEMLAVVYKDISDEEKEDLNNILFKMKNNF